MGTHAFQDWPRPYRILLNITAVTLCAAGLLAIGMVPGWNRYQEYVAIVKEKEIQASSTRWPEDSTMLRKRLDTIRKELDGEDGGDGEPVKGLRQIAAESIERAAMTFRSRILAGHVSATDFMCNVTRLDYKAIYNDVEAELATDGLKLSPSLLGLSDEDARTPVYQMIYKLWCVQRLNQLARASGMTVAPANSECEASFGSMVPLAYIVDEGDENRPYLLEFSTRAVLRGNLEQFRSFCASLCSESDFLPLTSLQISTTPPGQPATSGGEAVVETYDFTITCSAFFPAQ